MDPAAFADARAVVDHGAGADRQPSPITTSPAMHAKGSTMTSSPSFASGWMYASLLIMAISRFCS